MTGISERPQQIEPRQEQVERLKRVFVQKLMDLAIESDSNGRSHTFLPVYTPTSPAEVCDPELAALNSTVDHFEGLGLIANHYCAGTANTGLTIADSTDTRGGEVFCNGVNLNWQLGALQSLEQATNGA